MRPLDLKAAIAAGRVRPERRNEQVAVPTTGVQLLPRNPNRVAVEVANQGANFATVARRPIGAATIGFRLDAGGGFYSAKFEEFGQSIGDELFAAADTAQVSLDVSAWEAY